jgi:hypothetical protein
MIANFLPHIMDYQDFEGFKCLRIANEHAELFVSTEVGPRILGYRLKGGPNALGMAPETDLVMEHGTWLAYGGHRCWAAPEMNPRTYTIEDQPVHVEQQGERSWLFRGVDDTLAQLRKEVVIHLDADDAGVTVEHRITNQGLWPVRFACWGLSVMAPGGEAIIPQEPFKSHEEELLSARTLTLWGYTNMQDPRWSFTPRYIRLRADPALEEPQKIGIGNKQGWAGYANNGQFFLKVFPYHLGEEYPDGGCNCEFFTSGGFLEVESLGPMTTVEPGQSISHSEHWFLTAPGPENMEDATLDAFFEQLCRQRGATAGML